MTALYGLLKKEARFIRSGALVTAVVLLLYFVGLFVAARYYSLEGIAFFSVIPLAMSIWFVPSVLMTSLGDERKKLHVWLHNPQAAWKLLGTKLVVAIGVSVAWNVLNTVGMYAFFSAFMFDNELFLLRDWRDFALLGMGMLLVSSYFAIWFMFGWSVFHALKRFFKKMSLPVTIGLLVGVIILIGYIEMSGWFAQLVHWIGMSFNLPIGIEGHLEGSSGTFGMKVSSEDVNIVHLLFHVGIACLLFLLSCRLIDREVEV